MTRKPIDRRAEDLHRMLYERTAAEPLVWLYTARSLRRAAESLLPLVEEELRGESLNDPVIQVYMLLSGLALENLAKGICVARDSNVVKDDTFVGPRHHRLLDLFALAKLAFSKQESELVERLEEFVIWAGRYPISVKLESMLPRTQPNGGAGPLTIVSSEDPSLIHAMIDRAESILESTREATRATSTTPHRDV
jgi:hypothetical protein